MHDHMKSDVYENNDLNLSAVFLLLYEKSLKTSKLFKKN